MVREGKGRFWRVSLLIVCIFNITLQNYSYCFDFRNQERGYLLNWDFSMKTSEKQAIEAVLFVSGEPVSLQELTPLLDGGESEVREIVRQLQEEYSEHDRAFELREVSGGVQLKTRPELGEVLRTFYEEEKEKSLSRAALETLSIVAYEQPITRARVEEIRGVQADSILRSLLDEGFLEIVDRKDAPGRPMLYGTTSFFLEKFDLASIEDLPEPDRIESEMS